MLVQGVALHDVTVPVWCVMSATGIVWHSFKSIYLHRCVTDVLTIFLNTCPIT
jgi:hypothetical protein